MENNFDAWEMLKYVLSIIVSGLIGWNVWLHKTVIKNDKDIAINTARDDQMWNRIDKMINKLDTIEDTLTEIKIELAHEKGKNS